MSERMKRAEFSWGNDLLSAWHQVERSCETERRQADALNERRSACRPAKRETAGDSARMAVADKLARMVHVGLLESGDALPSERDMCEVFGVARQTVRAALGILEGRLMIAISHGRRSRVLGPGSLSTVDSADALKRLHERSASDVFQTLQFIEAQATQQAARDIGESTLSQLDVLVALLPRISHDALSYLMLEYELRGLIYGACTNKLLSEMAMDFYGYGSRLRRRLLGDTQWLQRSADLQVALVSAMHERDGNRAAQIMKEQAESLAALPLAQCGPEVKEPVNPAAAPHVPQRSAITQLVVWPGA